MSLGYLIIFCSCLSFVDNRMLPSVKNEMEKAKTNITPVQEEQQDDPFNDNKGCNDKDSSELDFRRDLEDTASNLNPCSIVVLSNIQNPSMQSIIRKYRYNSHGTLIPSSVQYYVKIPREHESPVLVRLNDNAFSPQGGFVRYYKEVPPIPRSW